MPYMNSALWFSPNIVKTGSFIIAAMPGRVMGRSRGEKFLALDINANAYADDTSHSQSDLDSHTNTNMFVFGNNCHITSSVLASTRFRISHY